jgi:adenine-specific DNA-methyltransferase
MEDFIKAGFTVVGTENNENKLLSFLKENYPNVIRDTEINLEELKTVLGLPIDEKVNGYGLNFVGRNFARAKYAQKTEKELRLNTTLSKNIDTTQNLVLKGDNLDSLKILKNHYSGQVKCIYIDPPYNTTSDEFVYPDKFDKEEAEVLGLANLSDSDFARMDFSFKTKRSHNGWLAFMYPRLLLARDLLSKEGVIFISIDDNEQANLKLLCDEIFGEENFVADVVVVNNFKGRNDKKYIATAHERLLMFTKTYEFEESGLQLPEERLKEFDKEDEIGRYRNLGLRKRGGADTREKRPKMYFPIYINPENSKVSLEKSTDFFIEIYPKKSDGTDGCWRWGYNTVLQRLESLEGLKVNNEVGYDIFEKDYLETNGEIRRIKPKSVMIGSNYSTDGATKSFRALFDAPIFNNPKSLHFLKDLISYCTNSDTNDLILDFFAGSGTTGHAVMQVNTEDDGNRKFILCQIDEPIKEDKPAYKFCIDNNLPPVISSITIERLKRAGEKIKSSLNRDLPDSRDSNDLFSYNQGNQTNQNNHSSDNNQKNHSSDIGFKVFDSVEAPKLKVDDKGQISIIENDTDALSRIYNMIFTVGLDEPTQVPEEVVKDCIYKIGNHYYITNSEKINSDDYSNAIKNGKVFIDGWTASLNGTLQNYKEDVKIVF